MLVSGLVDATALFSELVTRKSPRRPSPYEAAVIPVAAGIDSGIAIHLKKMQRQASSGAQTANRHVIVVMVMVMVIVADDDDDDEDMAR